MKWLCKSEHSINDTQSSSQELSTLTPLGEDPEHVSYDVESPFTNIPIKETIDYIKDQIYVQKNLKPICTKLIFQKLLLKLASECKFAFSNSFCQQTNGCTMHVSLSVSFSDIHIIKLAHGTVVQLKSKLYKWGDMLMICLAEEKLTRMTLLLNNWTIPLQK